MLVYFASFLTKISVVVTMTLVILLHPYLSSLISLSVLTLIPLVFSLSLCNCASFRNIFVNTHTHTRAHYIQCYNPFTIMLSLVLPSTGDAGRSLWYLRFGHVTHPPGSRGVHSSPPSPTRRLRGQRNKWEENKPETSRQTAD